MTLDEIKVAISGTPKAANVKLAMERPVKLLKAYAGFPIFKRTTMTVRIGIDNDNRKATQEARENGDRPAENQGLKGMEWVDFPCLLRSIKYPSKYYLRVEPSSNANEKPSAQFIVRANGIETPVTKDEFAHMMLASEKKSGRPYDACFNVGIDNIRSLHVFNQGEIVPEPAAADQHA